MKKYEGYVVIERELPRTQNSKYQGLGDNALGWPLASSADDLITKELSDEQYVKCSLGSSTQSKEWPFYLEVSQDFEFVKRYIYRCNELKISTELYYIAEDNNICNKYFIPLGYDCLGYSSYSYLFDDDDLFAKEMDERGIVLNQYGLFSTRQNAETYVSIRRNAINNGCSSCENYYPEKVVFCYQVICIS